jgi:hypothetical protein
MPTPKKKQWGGVRKGSGRHAEMKDGRYVQVYLDKLTLEALKKINANRSKAIRILAGTDKDGLE